MTAGPPRPGPPDLGRGKAERVNHWAQPAESPESAESAESELEEADFAAEVFDDAESEPDEAEFAQAEFGGREFVDARGGGSAPPGTEDFDDIDLTEFDLAAEPGRDDGRENLDREFAEEVDEEFDEEYDVDSGEDLEEEYDFGPVPVVAVVGRPNVGKSTLVNRILGRRQAVVEDVPGVTRDRVAYDAQWSGRRFTMLDTGGWIPSSTRMGAPASVRERAAAIAAQAETAANMADVVLFVVDATVGPLDEDEAAVRMLRRTSRPVILVANKVDNATQEMESVSLWSLGLGQPYPVSALHGRGSGELLDALLDVLPEPEPATARRARGPRRVALVGKPNVGKSSLLNRLAREQRAVVDPQAGTTVDPVDSLVEIGGEPWLLVDTAGLRRKVGTASGTEYYASLRTAGAIDAAEVAVVLIDASEPISEQDQRVLGMVEQAGRALVIAFNKWDLVDADRRFYLEKEIDRDLRRIPWAVRLNISAKTGRAVNRLAPALRQALSNWGKRVPTAALNQFVTSVVQATPHPVRGGRAPRVLFATQAGTKPPKFVLFTSGLLDPGYVRFIERRLREQFDFTGSPVQVALRPRKPRA